MRNLDETFYVVMDDNGDMLSGHGASYPKLYKYKKTAQRFAYGDLKVVPVKLVVQDYDPNN